MAGEDLSTSETGWAMGQIIAGDATGAQIAAFAVALRAKGETADEVTGLVDQLVAHALPLSIDGPTLDVVGTGGDQAQTVNISTMSAIVAAAAGARVVKNGNRAASSKCGSADVLEALGVVIDLPPEGVRRCVDSIGIGFCFARVFHPAMRHAAPTRSEIGIPTFFNILGPLANPAHPTAALVGCADHRLAPVMAKVLAHRGTSALVIRGRDGLDEVTIFDQTEVWDATRPSVIEHCDIHIEDMKFTLAEVGSLRGGDAKTNALITTQVFAGDRTGPLAAVRDAVAINAATALVAWDAAMGAVADGDLTARVVAQLDRVFDAIDSGASANLLDRWVSVSTEAAR